MSAWAVGVHKNMTSLEWTMLTHCLLDNVLCIQMLVVVRFCSRHELLTSK